MDTGGEILQSPPDVLGLDLTNTSMLIYCYCTTVFNYAMYF